jgi:hypothetical protein
MPTLSKARLTECESPWLETWDRMHQYLCPNKVRILTALGFYAEHDLPNPEADSAGSLTVDEKAELGAIATALTIAAVASDAMPTALLIATLHKVSSCPLKSPAIISGVARSPPRIGETFGEISLRVTSRSRHNRISPGRRYLRSTAYKASGDAGVRTTSQIRSLRIV